MFVENRKSYTIRHRGRVWAASNSMFADCTGKEEDRRLAIILQSKFQQTMVHIGKPVAMQRDNFYSQSRVAS